MIAAALVALALAAPAAPAREPPATAPPARAAPPPEAPPPAAPEEPPRRWVSVTLGLPAHLLFSGVELKGEFRAHDRLGLAAYGGLGSAFGVPYGQAGGQLRWYAVGDFRHGLALGADVNFLRVDEGLDLIGVDLFDAGGRAIGVGGFLGYKLVTRPGFTAGFDVGLRRHAITYEASASLADRGFEQDGEGTLWWPLADVQLGWSF